jgi:hypothetical protein
LSVRLRRASCSRWTPVFIERDGTLVAEGVQRWRWRWRPDSYITVAPPGLISGRAIVTGSGSLTVIVVCAAFRRSVCVRVTSDLRRVTPVIREEAYDASGAASMMVCFVVTLPFVSGDMQRRWSADIPGWRL